MHYKFKFKIIDIVTSSTTLVMPVLVPYKNKLRLRRGWRQATGNFCIITNNGRWKAQMSSGDGLKSSSSSFAAGMLYVPIAVAPVVLVVVAPLAETVMPLRVADRHLPS
jgi:hypothetical protein